jgi:5-methylcytosine-specific restriction endonuclease McrBC regulatory subunit McrC
LEPDEHQAIEQSYGFWRLVDAGYVSCRRSGMDQYEIEGKRYVGRALVDDIELCVCEKVPGTLVALVGAAAGVRVRLETGDSAATELDAVSRSLASEFIKAAEAYIANRRRPRYEYRQNVGPVLSGSLEIARTMRLHASGFPGRFAYQEGRLVRKDPLDKLVLAALESLDRLARSLEIESRTVYQARHLARALEEVRDTSFTNMSITELADMGDKIAADPATGLLNRDLANLASVVILCRGFELDAVARDERVPRAWFLNLEHLFEQAVRRTIRGVVWPDFSVDYGETMERLLFTGGSDSSRTNPDIVVHSAQGVAAIGDAKYKSLGLSGEGVAIEGALHVRRPAKKEGRPDIYQLLVHAASLDAKCAFLVYPSDTAYSCRYLGVSATGCRTWVVEVRPVMLKEDLTSFAVEADLVALGSGR